MTEYLIIYVICAFIVLGFQLSKAENPFITVDITFILGVVFCVLIAPIALCLIMGSWLHDSQQ